MSAKTTLAGRAAVIDLRKRAFAGAMRRIPRGKPGVETKCRLESREGALVVVIEADDHDMLNLVATVTDPGTDKFIYEEDCVQVAVAMPGTGAAADMLMVNARGSRVGYGNGKKWQASTSLDASGWRMQVTIPVPPDTQSVGLSVHRYFRGITGEVYGLANNLPHPLEPSQFACVVLHGKGPVSRIARAWRASAEKEERNGIEHQVDAVRKRIEQAVKAGVPRSFLAMARELAEKRMATAMNPSEGFLCWNEGHYQHALMDLWEITGKREWLDRLVPRVRDVWSLTGTARVMKDAMWHKALPTWYNDTESGTVCTLVSGAILWPISRLIRAVMTTPSLKDLEPVVSPWIAFSRTVLDLHDPEWIDFPDGSGMHLEPYGKGPRRVYPTGGSRINPLNREYFLSLPMLNIAAITGNKEYRRKVTANARYFKNTSDITPKTFCWEYLVAACPSLGEDLSHGSCQVAFAEQCAQEGIVLTEKDIRKIAGTLSRNVFKHADVPAGTLRGYHPALDIAVGTWSSLCRFVPKVFPKICAVVATAIHEKDRHFDGREGWGIRILTNIEKARQRMEMMSSCTG